MLPLCEAGPLFAVTILSESYLKVPSTLKIIMYDPVEEEGHLVGHIMASLSAYKSAVVSQCHLSFPFTPEDNNARAEGGRGDECLCALWAICRSKRCVAFSGDEMCFNLVRGDLSVGGDNDNFICIALRHKVYRVLEGGGEGGGGGGGQEGGRRLKVRQVKTAEK